MRARWEASVIAAVTAVGCSGVYEYPDVTLEQGAAACNDHLDNDLDGKVDCADSDCDGFCREADPAACSDDRDNDMDGLKDSADPGCWLFSAPQVQRCANTAGVEIIENFDAELVPAEFIFSPWSSGGRSPGNGGTEKIFFPMHRDASSPSHRTDGAEGFHLNTSGSPELDSNLGALMRAWAFSGSWNGAALSFSSRVPQDTTLRVAIAPVELVPVFSAPLPGAETALLGLTIDSAHGPPTISLDVEGAHLTKSVSPADSPCDDGPFCDSDFSDVRIVVDDRGSHATLTRPDGKQVNVDGPAPSSISLPPSRLVFWGGSTSAASSGAIDDLRLSVLAEQPCGFLAPQIPASSCANADDIVAFGQVVSVAKGEGYCALLTAGRDASTLHVDALTAWSSPDGVTWTSASPTEKPPLVLPRGAALIGAGIAHDSDGWHVAATYRDESDGAFLGLASGTTCGAFWSSALGLALFDDVEPPSYVIADGRHQVYFTRPPTDATPRSLWRISRAESGEAWGEPERVQDLLPEVASPVSVQMVGTKDLVLVHPVALGAGSAGVGLLVRDASGVFKPVQPSPVLQGPRRIENYGPGLTFDDDGILAAALAWGDENRGFFIYGGRSGTGLNTFAYFNRGLSVGSAVVAPGEQTLAKAVVKPRTSCGDKVCEASEDCASCPADCPCDGVAVLSSAFGAASPWQRVSIDADPSRVQYLDFKDHALNWAGGDPTWSVLPLDRAIGGDFELSFDLDMSMRPTAWCSQYVGLGTVPNETYLGGMSDGTQAGIFARFKYSVTCFGDYYAAPVVTSGASIFTTSDESVVPYSDCRSEERYWPTETKRHVLLRREGNHVSLRAAPDVSCGTVLPSIDYAGALPALPAVLVGFGGGALEDCSQDSGAGTISNLRLRLLDGAGPCGAGRTLCDTAAGPEQRTCVDLATSGEHCGTCDHACAANEVCRGGVCDCGPGPTILRCDGACIDTGTSTNHCGMCDQACARTCLAGVCDLAGDCASPVPLPPQSGTFPLQLAAQRPDATLLCEGWYANHQEIVSWTAPQSGTATFQVVPTGDWTAIIGVTEDLTCSQWDGCITPLNADEPIIKRAVSAQTTYLIGVGAFLTADPTGGSAELDIEVK